MGARIRTVWVFAFAAAAGLAGETLLFAERHCARLEESLREDFRVLLFLAPGPRSSEAGRIAILEESIRSQPEVLAVRYVSSEESLAALKRDDPELAESVALVGDNPLPGAFEVQPAPQALTRLGAWIDGVRRLASWSDIRYKSAQLQAVLRLRFYAHFLRVTMSALLCVVSALGLTLLFASARAPSPPRSWALAAWAGLGGVYGMAMAAMIVWPLHRDELLWAWPGLSQQVILVLLCASLGWSLTLWRAES